MAGLPLVDSGDVITDPETPCEAFGNPRRDHLRSIIVSACQAHRVYITRGSRNIIREICEGILDDIMRCGIKILNMDSDLDDFVSSMINVANYQDIGTDSAASVKIYSVAAARRARCGILSLDSRPSPLSLVSLCQCFSVTFFNANI